MLKASLKPRMYCHVTFGEGEKIYVFEVDRAVDLEIGKSYNIKTLDGSTYNTYITVKALSINRPASISIPYLKTIIGAEDLGYYFPMTEDKNSGGIFLQDTPINQNRIFKRKPAPTYGIKKVLFSGRKTIILWEDGRKTIVTAQEGDMLSKELGLAMALVKEAYSPGTSAFNEIFHKWAYDEDNTFNRPTHDGITEVY